MEDHDILDQEINLKSQPLIGFEGLKHFIFSGILFFVFTCASTFVHPASLGGWGNIIFSISLLTFFFGLLGLGLFFAQKVSKEKIGLAYLLLIPAMVFAQVFAMDYSASTLQSFGVDIAHMDLRVQSPNAKELFLSCIVPAIAYNICIIGLIKGYLLIQYWNKPKRDS